MTRRKPSSPKQNKVAAPARQKVAAEAPAAPQKPAAAPRKPAADPPAPSAKPASKPKSRGWWWALFAPGGCCACGRAAEKDETGTVEDIMERRRTILQSYRSPKEQRGDGKEMDYEVEALASNPLEEKAPDADDVSDEELEWDEDFDESGSDNDSNDSGDDDDVQSASDPSPTDSGSAYSSSSSSSDSEDEQVFDKWRRPLYIPLDPNERAVVRKTRKDRQQQQTGNYAEQMARRGVRRSQLPIRTDLSETAPAVRGRDSAKGTERSLSRKSSVRFTEAVVVGSSSLRKPSDKVVLI